jgi:hypothetical protein
VLDPDVVLRADGAAVRLGASGEVRGATAVADTFSGRARAAQPALVDGAPGLEWASGGRPRVVFAFTIADGKIFEIEMVADPESIGELPDRPRGLTTNLALRLVSVRSAGVPPAGFDPATPGLGNRYRWVTHERYLSARSRVQSERLRGSLGLGLIQKQRNKPRSLLEESDQDSLPGYCFSFVLGAEGCTACHEQGQQGTQCRSDASESLGHFTPPSLGPAPWTGLRLVGILGDGRPPDKRHIRLQQLA